MWKPLWRTESAVPEKGADAAPERVPVPILESGLEAESEPGKRGTGFVPVALVRLRIKTSGGASQNQGSNEISRLGRQKLPLEIDAVGIRAHSACFGCAVVEVFIRTTRPR